MSLSISESEIQAKPRLLLSPAEAADLLFTTEGTLRNWRHRRVGPPYVLLTRGKVGYRREALLKWLEKAEVTPRQAKVGRPRGSSGTKPAVAPDGQAPRGPGRPRKNEAPALQEQAGA